MKRRFVFVALAALVLVALACGDDYYSSSTPATPRPTATPTLAGLAGAFLEAELAAAEAEQAWANATVQAEHQMATANAASTLAADAEADVQAGIEATRWAIDSQSTIQARDIECTAQAMALEAARVEATMTAQAIYDGATATMEASRLTATAAAGYDQMTRQAIAIATTGTAQANQVTATCQAIQSAAEATSVQATSAAIERQDEADEATQVLTTFAGWALLGLAILAVGAVGYRLGPLLIPVLVNRWRGIRRKRDEGEIVFVEDDGRYTLPLRSANPLLEPGGPQPDPHWQDRATARQQIGNLALAQHAHQAPQRRGEIVVRPWQPAQPRPQARQPVPGLVRVVTVGSLSDAARQGILPPRLAQAVEGEWVQGEDEEE
ncbi:MAG: hypothetical protein JW900_12520 [Anaerolineae bacterium]|nr:hypothetical protein [Anaerolineae bacterium]